MVQGQTGEVGRSLAGDRDKEAADFASAAQYLQISKLYFELLLAARCEGGTMPLSGISFSILSERWCNGLSAAEENCGPALVGAVNPSAVYVASLKVVPDLAAATANTPCGTPLLKAVAM
jgi:hypothetical protein